MKIQASKTTQMSELEEENRELYHIVITTKKGTKMKMNVGKKSYDTMKQLIEEEENEIETIRKIKENERDKTHTNMDNKK